MKSKNSLIYIILSLVFVILSITMFVVGKNLSNNNEEPETPKEPSKPSIPISEGITITPTLLDNIASDTAWVPTLQLIWNDFKNDLCNGTVTFNEPLPIADSLSNESFTKDMISEEYYYKVYDLKTLELKKRIEDNIMSKFKQKSDILDKFDWSEEALDQGDTNQKRYFLYSMLYREFEYQYEFQKLENSTFKDKENIEYFGLGSESKSLVRNQIKVLFYEDDNNFAVSLKTKSNDEVILYKNPSGNTFNEVLDNYKNKVSTYNGATSLSDIDTFKMPLLKLNIVKDYEELKNKEFTSANPMYPIGKINQVVQSVQFEINEKGGKVKSEAGMDVTFENAIDPTVQTPKHFELNDTFVIMLKESTKDTPYFMARVEDITKFQ